MEKKTIIPTLFVFLVLNVILLTGGGIVTADDQKTDVPEDQSVTVQQGQGTPNGGNAETARETAVQDQRKDRLDSLFKAVKEKSKAIKPDKYEVTTPVSTAGARGAESRQADRFAVLWPDSDISPITALVENVQKAIELGEKKASIEAQLEEFKKVFPEYSDHELLKELADIIKKEL